MPNGQRFWGTQLYTFWYLHLIALCHDMRRFFWHKNLNINLYLLFIYCIFFFFFFSAVTFRDKEVKLSFNATRLSTGLCYNLQYWSFNYADHFNQLFTSIYLFIFKLVFQLSIWMRMTLGSFSTYYTFLNSWLSLLLSSLQTKVAIIFTCFLWWINYSHGLSSASCSMYHMLYSIFPSLICYLC